MFFVIIIIKITIITIIIIITTIIIINGTFSVIRAKLCFDVQKKMTKLPELGGEGGLLIRAMPERKRAFTYNVFPKSTLCFDFNDSCS